MYAGGESRPNGGAGEALRRRRQPGLSSSPGATAAAASSSSNSSLGRGEEESEEHGGGRKQGRRKKQGRREAVARAIRGGLPAACWGARAGVSVVQETGTRRTERRWSRRERSAADGDGDARDDGSGAGAGTAAAWCCVCPGGDCSLEPNPSANGKEEPGVRSLLERNDFFSADCNPHADVPLPGGGFDSS